MFESTRTNVLSENGHFAPTAFERKFIELRVWEPWMVEDAQFCVRFAETPPQLEGQGHIKNLIHVLDWHTLAEYLGAEGTGLGLEHAVDENNCNMRDCMWYAIKNHLPAIDRGFYVVFNIEWMFQPNK